MIANFSLQAETKGYGRHGRRHSRRLIATLIAASAACIPLVARTAVAGAATTPTKPTPNVAIETFGGDVFTVGSNGSLIPIDIRSSPASAPLFNLEGDPLNVTWGRWSSATAKSYAWTVVRHGVTHTKFLITMSGLIPNGVYSLFYRTFGPDSNNAFCPNVEPSVALTAAFPQLQKPDRDSFVASGSGKALFFATVAHDLLAAQQLLVSVIYHFDRRVYGPVPNAAEANGPVASNGGLCRSSYGIDAMRQFLIIQK